MPLDIGDLIPDMMNAAAGVLTESWPDAKDYAESEFKKTAETISMISRLYEDDVITEERAKLHLEFQKASMKTVLLTVEGLGIIAVERSINAALDVVKETVNTALGFALI